MVGRILTAIHCGLYLPYRLPLPPAVIDQINHNNIKGVHICMLSNCVYSDPFI